MIYVKDVHILNLRDLPPCKLPPLVNHHPLYTLFKLPTLPTPPRLNLRPHPLPKPSPSPSHSPHFLPDAPATIFQLKLTCSTLL